MDGGGYGYSGGGGEPVCKYELALRNERVADVKPYARASKGVSLILFVAFLAVAVWFSQESGEAQTEARDLFESPTMAAIGLCAVALIGFLLTLLFSPPNVFLVAVSGFLFGYVRASAVLWAA